MFSHIMVGANDLEQSKRFYDAVLGTLGVGPATAANDRYFYFTPQGGFAITRPINGEPATFANGGTIAFNAKDGETIDAWHAAGIANGGTTCEDPPGIREGAFGKIYLGYLRDPAGNKICAIHRMGK